MHRSGDGREEALKRREPDAGAGLAATPSFFVDLPAVPAGRPEFNRLVEICRLVPLFERPKRVEPV
jgi:hypothetical protein